MELVYIMFCHYVGDFCLQTEKQGKEKSSSNYKLLEHTIIYSIFMFVTSLLVLSFTGSLMMFFTCLIFHTLTDFFTSRASKKLYEKKKMNGVFGFWSVIGFDQFLHFVQIYLTYLFVIGGL